MNPVVGRKVQEVADGQENSTGADLDQWPAGRKRVAGGVDVLDQRGTPIGAVGLPEFEAMLVVADEEHLPANGDQVIVPVHRRSRRQRRATDHVRHGGEHPPLFQRFDRQPAFGSAAIHRRFGSRHKPFQPKHASLPVYE